MTKVLVIGSGGREQALAWKIAQSEKVEQVFVAPGNGGSKGKIKNADISYDDADRLLEFAKKNSIDLTVIGQEAASEAGVADKFISAGLLIFGPTKKAVKIESSKTFAKDLMSEFKIPTAQYKNFDDPEKARSYSKTRPLPVVIKADGLATGKGVIIAESLEAVDEAIDHIMVNKHFGDSGNKVVVEDFLKGREFSVHALCDGKTTVIFPASVDHKQIFDGDKGPNTGGIGVVAPVDWVNSDTLDRINDKVVQPAINAMKEKGAPFTGCLYPGLMLDGNDFNVVEFNARFGDPEAETYMRLFDGDLYEVLYDCASGQLSPSSVKWKKCYVANVVLCSRGYPGTYSKGVPISGIEKAEELDEVVVFHAGTAVKDGEVVTSGGRVLNVTATGKTLDEAINKAYEAVKLIHFDGMHFRRDIGRR
jgi:phosphoribosylamine---glycine ligase